MCFKENPKGRRVSNGARFLFNTSACKLQVELNIQRLNQLPLPNIEPE